MRYVYEMIFNFWIKFTFSRQIQRQHKPHVAKLGLDTSKVVTDKTFLKVHKCEDLWPNNLTISSFRKSFGDEMFPSTPLSCTPNKSTPYKSPRKKIPRLATPRKCTQSSNPKQDNPKNPSRHHFWIVSKQPQAIPQAKPQAKTMIPFQAKMIPPKAKLSPPQEKLSLLSLHLTPSQILVAPRKIILLLGVVTHGCDFECFDVKCTTSSMI